MKNVLTIAGSDSCGGAGIQADLKTFSAHGVYGMSIITAVTAQNTQGVCAVQNMSKEIVQKQIEAIFTDINVHAVKIGMVSQVEIINTISQGFKKFKPKNVVIDPVMVSKNGFDLLNPKAKFAFISNLIPFADVLTPNIPEAQVISDMKIKNVKDMEKSAIEIYKIGCKNVLVKGGHLEDKAVDVLFNGNSLYHFSSDRINAKNTHGTGCTLSSAIASNLALGCDVYEAVKKAKEYITIAIKHSFSIGKGVGPTNHFYMLYKKAGMLDK